MAGRLGGFGLMEWEDKKLTELGNQERKQKYNNLETFEFERFKRGKRNYWIYAGIEALIYILFNIVRSDEWRWFGLFLGLMEVGVCVSFLYHGFVWIWYFVVVKKGINVIGHVILLVIYIKEWYWMIYVYKPSTFLLYVALSILRVIQFIAIIIKWDLLYYERIKRMERKGLLESHIVEKMKTVW